MDPSSGRARSGPEHHGRSDQVLSQPLGPQAGRQPLLNLHQLRCFVAAAEELHFGRAASRLHLTQPTLSRNVQSLEYSLRVQLFDRANRTVRLTSAGLVFLPEAKRILTMTERAANWARRTWQGESGVIRLGFTATAAFADLPLILARASIELPDVKILLKESTSTLQKDDLLANTLDVAVVRPPIDRSRFNSMRMRSERFIAAIHIDSALMAKQSLTLEDFDGQQFIMYSADGAGYSHDMISTMFDQAGVSPVMNHHLDQNHSILALVSAGLGAALVPASLALLAFPNVAFREIALEPAEPVEMIMAWRRDIENPTVNAFIALCREIYHDTLIGVSLFQQHSNTK